MQKRFLLIVTFILLLTIIYSPIIEVGFSKFDDDWMLLNHELIRTPKFDSAYLTKVFTTFNDLQYSPINTLYYWFIYQIDGYDAYWFHLFSLIIHSFNIVLVWSLCKKLLLLFKLSFSADISCIITLLWAIHPVNVESVVWISASKIPLFALFNLISLISFLSYFTTDRKYSYIISLLSFIASCLCKEQALLLPVILLSFLICYKCSSGLVISKSYFVALLPFLLVSIIFGLISLNALTSTLGNQPMTSYPFHQRIIFSFYCLCFYLFNSIVPVDLHYHYAFPILPGQELPIKYYIFPITFIAIVFSISQFLNHKNVFFYLFATTLFFIQLSLCIHLIPLSRPAIMADRYMYLPSLGILLIVTPICYEYWKMNRNIRVKYIIAATAFTYAFSLAFYSQQLVEAWNKLNL